MKKKILLILAALLLIAAALTIGLTLGSAPAPQPTATPTPAVTATPRPKLQVDPNAGEQITPTPAPTLPGVAIPGWGSITIPAGVTEAAAQLMNPSANEGWYDLTFELRLKDTGEVIFTTGLVPAGKYLNKVTLTRALEAGEYAAILHVQPYTADEAQIPTNNADLETVLIVK